MQAKGELAGAAARAPAPPWADISSYNIPAAPNPHFIANGLYALLDDTQVDLCGPERAWFARRAELITANAGAERAARFEASFDPAYERLEIHGVRVIRGDRIIDYTDAPGFEVLRRERNLEHLHYDGRSSVHFTLPDVRVGDVVEFMHTIYGMRKALGGRHGAWIGFEWEVGVVDVRHRLRAPEGRIVHERRVNNPPEAIVTSSDGVIDKRWRAFERPGVKIEASAPPWVLQRAEIQFSEWKDWAEVAAGFAPLYAIDGDLPAELETEIARIGAETPDQAHRAAAILRFVQSAVRYLAISIGEGGFTPRSIAEIFATRYGDCKDKARLFVAMAQRLGIDACPALVNTGEGMALDQWLASGIAFNHCIVRVRVGDATFWLDPTRALQPSRLERVSQCHYGWALPLDARAAAGEGALEHMPDPNFEQTLESHERVELGDSAEAPVRYEWRHVFRGHRAENVRDRLARDGAVGMFKSYSEDVARIWPEARPIRQEVLSDNQAENELVLIEIYEAPRAWKQIDADLYEFATLDLTLRQSLPAIGGGERKHPIYLGVDGRIVRHVHLERPTPIAAPGWLRAEECATISFKSELTKPSRTSVALEQTLDIRGFTVAPGDTACYRKIQSELANSDLVISDRMSGGKFVGELNPGESGDFWSYVRWILIIGWLAWIGYRLYLWQTGQ